MAIDINELGINEAIRYHKPNDPYYWEVDNLPLIDIMRNIVLTAAKINELVIEINNHYDKGEIDSLRTRDLFDVDNVTPGLNDVLKWNGATYTPGPGSNWTYELEDVYNPNPGTNPNASNVEGTVLKWSEVLNPPQFYQSQLELDDIYNVEVPKWNDYWSTSNPGGHRDGDILMFDNLASFTGKYVNKQNTIGNLTDCDPPPPFRSTLTTTNTGTVRWDAHESTPIQRTMYTTVQEPTFDVVAGGTIYLSTSNFAEDSFGAGVTQIPAPWKIVGAQISVSSVTDGLDADIWVKLGPTTGNQMVSRIYGATGTGPDGGNVVHYNMKISGWSRTSEWLSLGYQYNYTNASAFQVKLWLSTVTIERDFYSVPV